MDQSGTSETSPSDNQSLSQGFHTASLAGENGNRCCRQKGHLSSTGVGKRACGASGLEKEPASFRSGRPNDIG
ncbi:hypothetical protein Y1Q_0013996 [Alligator mississippiensis]|uniref:Uncharacterized protein n=1 Tax=Alligator mississippiensis TaxID=8496 RepID=A0A151PDC3_ALLMI|nr:hypothetical protein Y1Q_0013996 [Alligator mississippiensis]